MYPTSDLQRLRRAGPCLIYRDHVFNSPSGLSFVNHSRRLITNDVSAAARSGSLNTVAGDLSTKQPAQLRGLAAFRARPLLHILSFGLLHQSIAWAALPPLFYFFQATGAATSLLAGPQVAWVLSRPVPGWLPVPFVDTKEARRKGTSEADSEAEKRKAEQRLSEAKAGIAGAVTGWIKGNKDLSQISSTVGADKHLERLAREGREAETKARAKGEKPLLVEDVVEQVVRRAVRTGVTLSKTIYGQAQTWGKSEDEMAGDAIKTLEGKHSWGSHVPDFGLGDRVRKTAEGVSFREVLDGAAAYIVVKVFHLYFSSPLLFIEFLFSRLCSLLGYRFLCF